MDINENLEKLTHQLLLEIGEDPNREGLKERLIVFQKLGNIFLKVIIKI